MVNALELYEGNTIRVNCAISHCDEITLDPVDSGKQAIRVELLIICQHD